VVQGEVRFNISVNVNLCYRVKFEQVEEAASFILSQTKHRPVFAIICGTGLGTIGEIISDGETVPYESIPHFSSSKGNRILRLYVHMLAAPLYSLVWNDPYFVYKTYRVFFTAWGWVDLSLCV
jgi:hypothetical protein